MFLANELESIALPTGRHSDDTSARSRCPRRVFENLCLLGNREHSQFLQLQYIHKTFSLRLIESVLTNQLFCKHSELLFLLQHRLFPCSSKPSPSTEHSAYPPPFRDTHVVFLLLQQFSSQLETKANLIPAALIKLINGKADADEPGPGWMWVLAMEIMRGLVAIPSSRTVSGSITIPWQQMVAPAAPLAHASSPPSYPPSSSWSPHVPPCSASPLRCMVWVYLRATLNRTL
ncbi:hypothetical protein BGY98DRAFT_233640 [Russula aff. rugulosa BPL654]|nr:hypothetical protein BGY98DRAFT_233640 [Russula aff. rugulosa BPL654]